MQFRARSSSWLAAVAFCVGCSGTFGDDDDNRNESIDSGSGGEGTSTGVAGAGGGITSTTSSTSGSPGDEVCARWQADRADLSEGSWSGSVAQCSAGDVSPNGRANALKLVNLYRWLSELPEVVTDPSKDKGAQACALMMDANNTLSHQPPANWACYGADGAATAGKSNLATTPGVQAVDLYMADPGNETTMGHRRWILSNSLGPIGLGTTSSYSCQWVIGGSGNAGNPYTAFPPAGPVPYGLFVASFAPLDQTGWTIQSDGIDLSGAVVSVTESGADLPVKTTKLAANYGSKFALKFLPQGWQTQAGRTYHVSVAGTSQPISYDVEVVACP